MESHSTLGLIPARGGSKGIQYKNIKNLVGKPMVAHSIEAARNADSIDATVVSTEDDKIADIASDYGARVPFRRPAELATDEISVDPVIEHALSELRADGHSFDTVALLLPTSPLRTSTHIDEAFELFVESGADSVVSVYPDTSHRWRKTSDGAQMINYQDAPNRRQDRTPEYVSNGAITITAVDAFEPNLNQSAGQTALYEMSEAESIDVDTEFDLWLAKQILERFERTANPIPSDTESVEDL
jgi:CMP-N,N'-diacetyllegionaminic acid synthase